MLKMSLASIAINESSHSPSGMAQIGLHLKLITHIITQHITGYVHNVLAPVLGFCVFMDHC